MHNFINVGGIFLNLAHVKAIIDHEDGTCTVITDDGERYTNVDSEVMDSKRETSIRAVIPCTGVYARMERDGQETYPPVRYLCLTESGDVLPLNLLACDHDDRFEPGMEYMGLIIKD